MSDSGTKPELEIYDVGHLYNILHIKGKCRLDEPLYLQFVTGIVGGIGASIENLLFLKRTADRLFGRDQYHWSAIGAGRMQFPTCTASVFMNGHCRVGLEDNLNLDKHALSKSSAEQVKKIVRIIREFSCEPATPEETRKMMGL